MSEKLQKRHLMLTIFLFFCVITQGWYMKKNRDLIDTNVFIMEQFSNLERKHMDLHLLMFPARLSDPTAGDNITDTTFE